MMKIQTIQGKSASVLGLAGQNPMESGCVDLAWRAGVNFFFSYGMGSDSPLLTDLCQLIKPHREGIIFASGHEGREIPHWQTYLEQIRQTLDIETVDILFVEYVSPSDDWNQVQALLDKFYAWKSEGRIRYVGVTTHNRPIALRLVQHSLCDILMHRYNMAHRKAEQSVFPAAVAAEIPVVSFTSTRWGQLLNGHPDWQGSPPTAADCYGFSLSQPAIQLTLTAPKTRNDLESNLAVLENPAMLKQDIAHWQRYGDLVYGTGQDGFETNWP
ncbi:MAG: aldo/keto reductase [Cyanobacteria bacterium P01_F01_bin.150]